MSMALDTAQQGGYADAIWGSQMQFGGIQSNPGDAYPAMTEFPPFPDDDSCDGNSESLSDGTPNPPEETVALPELESDAHSLLPSLDEAQELEYSVPPSMPPAPKPLAPVRAKERYTSLDVVRGMAVF